MIDDIDRLIRRETSKAIREILDANLSDDKSGEERKRQKIQHTAISDRNLQASDDASKKDQDEDDDEEKRSAEEESPEKQADRTKGRGTADSPKLADPKKEQLRQPSVGMIVDKLNALRGGRSLKHPEVLKSFTQYYNGLTNPEKQSLVIFVTGIAQVLAGSEAGAQAIDPGDVGLRVKGKTADRKQEPKEKSKEGTPSNPIVVGEVSSKHSILKALKEYSRHR